MAKGGGLQNIGAGLGIAGALALLVNLIVPGAGVVLASGVSTVGGATITSTFTLGQLGAGLVALGAVSAVAGSILTPYETDTPSGSRQNSPAYTFDAPRNPPKGDAVYPIPFGITLVRGPVLASFTTPKGLDADEEFGKVLRNSGQAVSIMIPVSVGRFHEVMDVRLNSETLFRRYEDSNGDPKTIGTGDGSTKKFKVKAKRLILDSVRVYVDGVLKGTKSETVSFNGFIDQKRLYTIDYPGEVDYSRAVSVELDGVTIDGSGDKDFVVVPIGGGSSGFMVYTLTHWPIGARLKVTFYIRTFTGGLIQSTGKGFEAVFVTAPSSGADITATYKRNLIKGVTTHIRRGTKYQIPMPGFNEIKQDRGLGNEEVTSSEIVFTTNDAVDDVKITLTTGGPFLAQDQKGRRNPAQANFRVRFKPHGEGDESYLTLLDPVGAKSSPEKKNGDEFRVVGETMNEQTFHLSIRGILDKAVQKRPSTRTRGLRAAWTRQRYTIEIKRTNKVKADTNSQFADRIYAVGFTEVRDVSLSWPGIGLLGFHGVGSEKLNGAFPLVDAVVSGLADVEVYSGSVWAQDDDAHRNPVWAAVEAWTNKEWGGGRRGFTKALNVDADSAKTAADFCDAAVGVEGRTGYSEVRARFDATLDTRQSLFAVVRDMLLPGFIVPVLQGDTLRFAIDQSVTLADVPVYSADAGSSKYIERGVDLERTPLSAQATELEAIYWDEEQDFEHREVFVPSEPGTAVRVRKRVDFFGVTRRTQAARVAKFIHTQTVNAGPTATFGISLVALRHEAGDVFGVTDTNAGITSTRYFRCLSVAWPSMKSPKVQMTALEYVPASYGQEAVSSAPSEIAPPPPVSFVASSAPLTPRGPKRYSGVKGGGGSINLRRKA